MHCIRDPIPDSNTKHVRLPNRSALRSSNAGKPQTLPHPTLAPFCTAETSHSDPISDPSFAATHRLCADTVSDRGFSATVPRNTTTKHRNIPRRNDNYGRSSVTALSGRYPRGAGSETTREQPSPAIYGSVARIGGRRGYSRRTRIGRIQIYQVGAESDRNG